jgi:hypothetical protein
MSTLLIGPFYLAYVLDLSLTSVGLVASLGPMIGAISGFPAGSAYTGANRTSIPALSGHPFRFNPDTDSGINQPVFV